MLDFNTCFDRLIGHEGGYVNNPKDPGGETNWGISKRSYPNINIKTLTRDAAKLLYKKDFWDRVNADKMLPSLAYQAFDFAVNSGIETAIRYLQRALKVADDGYWGPATMSALKEANETDILMLYLAERLDFMTKLTNWENASRGWSRRIATNLRYAAQDA